MTLNQDDREAMEEIAGAVARELVDQSNKEQQARHEELRVELAGALERALKLAQVTPPGEVTFDDGADRGAKDSLQAQTIEGHIAVRVLRQAAGGENLRGHTRGPGGSTHSANLSRWKRGEKAQFGAVVRLAEAAYNCDPYKLPNPWHSLIRPDHGKLEVDS